MTAKKIIKELLALANEDKATVLSSFFKTKKGDYAEGDIFLGVTVPQIRKLVAQYKTLSLTEVAILLKSKYHECRFAALVILIDKFERGNETDQQDIYNFYLRHTQYINNWDLVDVSCHKIVGYWLLHRERTVLYNLAKSSWLWDQRIAIVSTFAFIRNHEFDDTLRLSKQYLMHNHHLIHKACGWMLREVGKRDKNTLIDFLDKHAAQMPRVMLRYSIEKLSKDERKNYLRVKTE